MFGIGFSELVLIALLLVIFIKPEDLPKFFRTIGRWYGKIKKVYNEAVSVKDKIIKEIDDAVTLEEKTAETAGAKTAAPEKAAGPAAAGALSQPDAGANAGDDKDDSTQTEQKANPD